MAQTVSLSSIGTATLLLDYIGAKTTTARVTVGSFNGAATLEMTLDSSAATGVAATWFSASTTAISSALTAGLTVNFLTPIAGLRLNASSAAAGTLTLTALQNAGG